MNKALDKPKNGKPDETISVLSFIKKNSSEFAKVIPQHMNADRMLRLALSAIRTTPHLSECTVQSVAVSLMACSALGLEPNTPQGHAYLIPYKCRISKRNEPYRFEYRCQLIIGYRGLIELFYRSGAVQSVQAYPVFKGDQFSIKYGLNQDLVHIPCDDPKRYSEKRLTHVYAIVRLKDGADPIWVVMDRNQIDMVKRRSKAGDEGPWETDYISMAMKTVIRAISRFVPFSVDKISAASSAETAIEAGYARRAVNALGPDVEMNAARLLEGVKDDEPITYEMDEEVHQLSREEEEEMEMQKVLEQMRSDCIKAAQELWGDSAMEQLKDFTRNKAIPPFGITSATREQCIWLMDELSLRIEARDAEAQ